MGVVINKSTQKNNLLMLAGTKGPITVPPVYTGGANITGLEYEGETLTANVGAWSGAGITYTAQWYRGASGVITDPIVGAINQTYVLTASEVGQTVWARITGTNVAGSDDADTPATGVIGEPLSVPTRNTVLNISGSGLALEVLTVTNPDDWVGNPTPVVTGQWRKDGVLIPGETNTTYTPSLDDIGSAIDYQEFADNSFHSIQTADSNDITVLSSVFRVLSSGDIRTVSDGSNRELGQDVTTSPEAQAVLDRMTALTQTEEDAIVAFVDGLVADGLWDAVYDCWATALTDGNDASTGFKVKADTWLVRGGTNAHVPGQGWDFDATGFKWSEETFDQLPTVTGCLLYVSNNSQYGPVNNASNVDTAGTAGGTGNDCYLRTRNVGNGEDHNVAWDHTSATAPRPTHTGQLVDDVVGWGGLAPNECAFLAPGGALEQLNRTDGTRSNVRFQFNGRNNNGTAQNMGSLRHSFWMFLDGAASTDLTQFRTRINTFLTAIGVTGVPT